jgi:hypothetical protein
MNPEVDGISGVEDAHVRILSGGLTFARFPLAEVANGLG